MKNGHPEEQKLQAPTKLLVALHRLPREPIFVPLTVDEAVLNAARRQLGNRVERVFDWFRLMPWMAAVTLLVLLVFLAQFIIKPPSRQPSAAVFNREDLNHDGRVDILDAFALARQLKSGAHLDPQLDINGDGVVDEHDAEAIAAHAVSLAKGGRS